MNSDLSDLYNGGAVMTNGGLDTGDLIYVVDVSAGSSGSKGMQIGQLDLRYDASGAADSAQAAAEAASVPLSTITTAGDLLVGAGAGAVARLGIGTTGQVVGISGGSVAWVDQSGGGGASLPLATSADQTIVENASEEAILSTDDGGNLTAPSMSISTLTVSSELIVAGGTWNSGALSCASLSTNGIAGTSLNISGALADGTYPISNSLGGYIAITNGVIVAIVPAS